MDNIIAISISALSLLVSLFVVWNNLWSNMANVKITQSKPTENRSWILKSYNNFMLVSPRNDTKKMIPTMESITLVEVTITNNSSLPISVLEFQMNGAIDFTSYSHIHHDLKVTTENGDRTYFSCEDDPLTYLQPEFTLEPYTSKRGHLMFWMHNKESIQPGKHKLIILTSRKKFTRDIEIPHLYEAAKKYMYSR